MQAWNHLDSRASAQDTELHAGYIEIAAKVFTALKRRLPETGLITLPLHDDFTEKIFFSQVERSAFCAIGTATSANCWLNIWRAPLFVSVRIIPLMGN